MQTKSKNQKKQKSEKKQLQQYQMQAAINRYDNSQQGKECKKLKYVLTLHFSGRGGNPQSRKQTKISEDKLKDQKGSNTFQYMQTPFGRSWFKHCFAVFSDVNVRIRWQKKCFHDFLRWKASISNYHCLSLWQIPPTRETIACWCSIWPLETRPPGRPCSATQKWEARGRGNGGGVTRREKRERWREGEKIDRKEKVSILIK